MGKLICVVSGKGGTGKTTVTANVALSMAKLKHKTLVIDTDLGLRNMDLALGLQDNVMYDVLDVSEGNCKTREAVISDEKYPYLHFLPASQFKDSSVITAEEMKIVADKVKEDYEYIFIDCPAGLGESVSSVAAVCDSAIIVVNPDPFSIRDADRIAELMSASPIKDMWLVINRFRPNFIKSGQMLNLMQIIEKVAVKLIGAVPESDEIFLSVLKGEPYTLNNTASFFDDIAKRITGEKIAITEILPKKKGIFKRKNKH